MAKYCEVEKETKRAPFELFAR